MAGAAWQRHRNQRRHCGCCRYVREKIGVTGRKAILILTDNLGLNYKSPMTR